MEWIMGKIVEIEEIKKCFHDGMTILYGGFMGVGTPEGLVKALLEYGAGDLTIIGNDTAFPDVGVGPLIVKRRVRKVVASHVGTNPETGRQMLAGELDVELVPQGTLAERIRCGGGGLGGVLTETGIGTMVETGKIKLALAGRQYLVEQAIRGDIALIKAKKADTSGNLVYERASRNFNPLMALAAERVIVEADELVEVGALDPEYIITPGVVVHKIVLAERD
jgi:acetate CoA/acetoacetate CoA-transferase alpha subunit